MSTTSQIKIGDSTYNVDDLLAKAEDGTLYEYLEPELSKIAGEAEASQLLSDVYDSIEALKSDYEEMISGVEEDEEGLDRDLDGDLYEVKKDRYEEEIDDIEALIDELDSTLYVAIQDVVNDYGRYHIRTDADIKFTPTVDYDDGDVVDIQATGGKVAASTDGYDGEDLTGEGIVTYHDYDAYLANQADNRVDGSDQGIFVYLEPEDTVQGMTYADGVLSVEVYNSRTSKTVTLDISGIMNNVNVYFEFGLESALPSSVYNHLPKEVKQQMFVNEDIYSLYEQGLDRTAEDKLSFIDRYDEIKEGAAAVTADYATNSESALPYVEKGLEIMFGHLNDPEANNNSVAEAMANYLDVLEEITDPQLKSDALVAFVMTMVKEAGQNYFQGMLGETIPTLIEEIFLEDESLTKYEMLACLVLETQTGGVGKFGGAEILSLTTGVSSSDTGTLANVGGIFYIDNDNGQIAIHNEYWQNEETTKAAVEAYKELILEVGWTGDAGAVDEILNYFELKTEFDETPKLGHNYADALSAALSALAEDGYSKDIIDLNLFDGITGGNWYAGVESILKALKGAEGKPFDEVAAIFRDAIALIGDDNWDGDILSSVIFYLYHAGGEYGEKLLQKIFEADPDLKAEIKNTIKAETENPLHSGETSGGAVFAAIFGIPVPQGVPAGALQILDEF
ncbi:hypothetical protein KJ708_09530 [bacterium]|nr:hypothetical protein [bacterium]